MPSLRIPARIRDWLPTALIAAACVVAGAAISLAIRLPTEDEFNLIDWELRELPGKWLYLAGSYIEGSPSPAEENEQIGRYLELTARIRQVGATSSTDDVATGAELRRLVAERDALENGVEATIEGRLTSVLEAADLQSSLPFFPGARWVFPPVDFAFAEPPRLLNVSPRDRIELIEQRPLRPGLDLARVIELEEREEESGDRSALSSSVVGIAAYPSAVAPTDDYARLVETVAHEWVHHYLAFKPLGFRYFSNLELQTLNETVADLAGKALGELFTERYPLPAAVSAEPDSADDRNGSVDVDETLRKLRLDVDELLAIGDITEAEELMEEVRLELAAEGVLFRRINQAFFAFRNIYAGDPVSVDPIGGKVQALRDRSGSVGEFLRAAAQLTDEEKLDELLASTSAGP